MMIKLNQAAYVRGTLRSPDDGCIEVDDTEGKDLVEVRMVADDVTADFAEPAKPAPSKPAA